MQEIQFFGLYFPPLLVAIFLGFILARILVKVLNRLSGNIPCCGAFVSLTLTITLSSTVFYIMYL
ncbi:MAG: DUF1656 domain-containing protein [gamma proteobacterium symbiont of Taylorina sp.]|nr:DUF1656 domain-containing protein [gamma proteobacterium symbiont of Taylorina sp.]